jgi:hypothetical protein
VPLTNSYNSLAQSNEQPEYQALWEPIAFNPNSNATITNPANSTFPTYGYAIPGSLLMYGLTGTFAGVGSYPPLGFGQSYPGGDAAGAGATGNATFPYSWTVQQVDAASVSTTTNAAGICLGFGSLGGYASPQANTTPSLSNVTTANPIQVAMVGKRGIMQVLFDGNTTAGNTFQAASTSGHIGACKDSGGTTRTYGTMFGVILQTVSLTNSTPQLVWCHVNMP